MINNADLYRNYNQSDDTCSLDYSVSKYGFPNATTIWDAPAGKHFLEWNTSRNGSGTSVQVGGDGNADVPYYAIWELDPVDYITTNIELTSIADAIRGKTGDSEMLSYPNDFVEAINSLEAGISANGVSF